MDIQYSIEPYIWWLLDRRIAGMPMPYFSPERISNPSSEIAQYDDDIQVIVDAGFRSVISLVNSVHADIFSSVNIDFCAIPIPDVYPPTPDQVEKFRTYCESCRRPITVHCEGGVGRTGTMIALWLIFQGNTNEAAIRKVRDVLPSAIETNIQEHFVLEFSPE